MAYHFLSLQSIEYFVSLIYSFPTENWRTQRIQQYCKHSSLLQTLTLITEITSITYFNKAAEVSIDQLSLGY
jgi:muconolactone delta-isomerase